MIVHWILISVCFLSLSLAIWKISNNKTDKTVLRCGVALIFVGLFCSLYAYLAPKSKPDDAEIELLKNFFLIISSIGANLLASSALIERRTHKTSTCYAPDSVSLAAQVPSASPSQPTN